MKVRKNEVLKNESEKGLTACKVNTVRRKLLQGAAVSTGAVLVPGLASAIASSDSSAAGIPEPVARTFDSSASDASVVVEFSDPEANYVDGALARVSIYNNGEKEVVLSQLSISNVTTQQGVYDINSRLRCSPIAVGPEGVYHFWLSPGAATGTQAKPTGQSTPIAMHATSSVKVQLRILRGESEYSVAQNNRMVDALVEYRVG